MTNTVIADNRAGVAGAGMYLSYPTARLLHTTIARNSGGDGSGIYVVPSLPPYNALVLANTILVSQSIALRLRQAVQLP